MRRLLCLVAGFLGGTFVTGSHGHVMDRHVMPMLFGIGLVLLGFSLVVLSREAVGEGVAFPDVYRFVEHRRCRVHGWVANQQVNGWALRFITPEKKLQLVPRRAHQNGGAPGDLGRAQPLGITVEQLQPDELDRQASGLA